MDQTDTDIEQHRWLSHQKWIRLAVFDMAIAPVIANEMWESWRTDPECQWYEADGVKRIRIALTITMAITTSDNR